MEPRTNFVVFVLFGIVCIGGSRDNRMGSDERLGVSQEERERSSRRSKKNPAQEVWFGLLQFRLRLIQKRPYQMQMKDAGIFLAGFFTWKPTTTRRKNTRGILATFLDNTVEIRQEILWTRPKFFFSKLLLLLARWLQQPTVNRQVCLGCCTLYGRQLSRNPPFSLGFSLCPTAFGRLFIEPFLSPRP